MIASLSCSYPVATLCCCAYLHSSIILAFITLFQLYMNGTRCRFMSDRTPCGDHLHSLWSFICSCHLRCNPIRRIGQVHCRKGVARESFLLVLLVECQYLLHRRWGSLLEQGQGQRDQRIPNHRVRTFLHHSNNLVHNHCVLCKCHHNHLLCHFGNSELRVWWLQCWWQQERGSWECWTSFLFVV